MDGLFGLGLAGLGLGLGGDIFNAISNQQQQQRQRNLYQKSLDPNYQLGVANQYYNANLQNLRSALPQLERTSINPEIGQRGLSGGAAQSLYDQTVAMWQQQAWQDAMNRAAGGVSSAGQFTGQPTGTGGGTAGALNSLMLLTALRGGMNPAQAQTGYDTTNLTTPTYTSTGVLPMQNYQGGPQLDFGFSGTNPFTSISTFGSTF